jgi:ankyrin repeat protein
VAIRAKTENIVKLLLKGNADPNVLGHDYQTPLQTAAFNGSESIVRLLLEANADVNLESISLRSDKNDPVYTPGPKKLF